MEQIKLIPIFYVNGSNASIKENEEKNQKTLELAACYNNNGADGILLIDCSANDSEHDATIGECKEIVRTMEVPLYIGGNIKRLEDVKKYLYTGAAQVIINSNSETEMAVYPEAVERFGADRVVAMDIVVTPYGESFCNNSAYVFVEAEAVCDFYAWKKQLKADGIPVITYESAISWSEFKLNEDGLIPCIVQDYRTNEVLMMAYMNEAAFEETITSGRMCYFSRSRQQRWLKGETSGHFQYIKSLHLDCDNDTLLAKVAQVGAACHTGAYSCFFQILLDKGAEVANPHKVFEEVYQVIEDRKLHPKEGSYTNYLFDKGIDKILKKCGEEATEIVIAAKNPDPEEIKYEISDFLYHVMVLMVEKGVTWEDITRELANR